MGLSLLPKSYLSAWIRVEKVRHAWPTHVGSRVLELPEVAGRM